MWCLFAEEDGEPAQRGGVATDGADRLAGGQPEPGPSLDGRPQPRLSDATEADQVAARVGRQAEPAGIPRVPLVLLARTGLVRDVADPLVGVAHERRRVAVPPAARRGGTAGRRPVRGVTRRAAAAGRSTGSVAARCGWPAARWRR